MSSDRSRNSPRLPVANAMRSAISRPRRPRKRNANLSSSARPASPLRCRSGGACMKSGSRCRASALKPQLERQEPLAVRRRKTHQLAAHPLAVAPPGQHRAVGRDRLERWLRGDHAQTLLVQLEVADDLGPQHARHVGRGRDTAAGRRGRIDLLGHAAAAQHVATLEHEGTQGPRAPGRTPPRARCVRRR